MDTRKKDSYKLIISAVIVLLSTFYNVLADSSEAAKTLANSYQLPAKLTIEATKRIISDLEQAVGGCKDDELVFRMRYRIGILYFKTGCPDKAYTRFKQISRDVNCPELIRLCSLNMAGQISRMLAKDKDALEAFDQLIKLSKKYLLNDNKDSDLSTVLKLNITAAFGKAEIYQYQQNYDAAIAEYRQILAVLAKNKTAGFDSYISLSMDRISQLSLMHDDLERYIKTAQKLIENHPDYYRVTIIKFETEAVKFLKSVSADTGFPNGSFGAPTQLIAYLKSSKDKILAQQTAAKLDRLCKEHISTYSDVLLNYHYAWLLDTIGEKEKAAEILSRIILADTRDVNHRTQIKAVIDTISEYAKVQRAIILGEAGDYKQALQALSGLESHPDNIHLSNLAKSVQKSIKILKREVPRNYDK